MKIYVLDRNKTKKFNYYFTVVLESDEIVSVGTELFVGITISAFGNTGI